MDGRSVKVALYNRYWSTLGGGEQLAAGIANALRDEHEVELLVHASFDNGVASERLGVPLDFAQRVIDEGTRPFLGASADYDLLVNTSFASTYPSRARRSLYYVHFPMPHPPIDDPRGTRAAAARAIGASLGRVEFGAGCHDAEFRGGGRWTAQHGHLDLLVPAGAARAFVLELSGARRPAGDDPVVEVRVDGRAVFTGHLGDRRAHRVRCEVVGRGEADPIPVEVLTTPFVPRVATGVADDRALGVVIEHAGFTSRDRARAQRWADRVLGRFDLAFLDSYDAIVANSPYTAGWVQKVWGRSAEVLAPPVGLRRGGEKRPMILSVGRFFPDSSGHSKKQLELVQAFRLACDAGLTGWELCLAGGCAPDARGYVEAVRTAAQGLAVRCFVNARGQDLDELFAEASLFWHGAGYGEDAVHAPDRFEHFGISVIEGMSAGAVPVVFAVGGPAEVVERGQTGEHFRTLAELAAVTRALAADDDRRAAMGAAAAARAHEFGPDQFRAHVRTLVASLT